MIFEIILLALASTVRPTSLAAVSTLLTRDSRRRLMFAYVVGGLVFTLLFGFVVVGVFHGIHLHTDNDRKKGIADVIGGAIILAFGAAVLTGHVQRRPRKVPSGAGIGAMAQLDRHATIRVAAIAGALTHLPGIFYLVALNLIVAHNPALPGGVVALAVYNGIWFALPIVALVLCIVDPDAAETIVDAVQAWTKPHSRQIVLITCLLVGIALLIRGLLAV